MPSREPRVFSAPTVINLELTEACNVKCRHCYNPWRDESAGAVSLTRETLDRLIDQFAEAGVFHVVLSGGEPLARMDLLEHGIRRFTEEGLSVSCNSNLMLATPDRIKRLAGVGLDHVLTSWYSSDPAETDFITGKAGAHDKLVAGIRTTVGNGIRVSANVIVTAHNRHRIYESGRFLHGLGVKKFFAHRVVPPAYDRGDSEGQHTLSREDALFTLDELLRLERDTGMIVGTLISYPLCLLGDLEKYAGFAGRGCPSQAGHRFNVNASGDTHCCVMEDRSYGNVFEIGIKKAYANAHAWHRAEYHYEGCEGCHYLAVCETGCRMSALATSGRMAGPDPLMVGKEAFVKPLTFSPDPDIVRRIEGGARFSVPDRLRFRAEDGFHLLNIRWGNTIIIKDDVAAFLLRHRDSGGEFDLDDFGRNRAAVLVDLFYKDALACRDIPPDRLRSMDGVSLDPSKLGRT